MIKVTPIKKLSKKKQREYYTKRWGSWNGVNPTTRVAKSKKTYDRNRMKQAVEK